jgi:hypothetical protein
MKGSEIFIDFSAGGSSASLTLTENRVPGSRQIDYRRGVSVSNWLINRPPIIVIPSGRRVPNLPRAEQRQRAQRGRVVIMMGRRSRQADRWRLPASYPLCVRRRAQIDHHDGVLLHNADQQLRPMSTITLKSCG